MVINLRVALRRWFRTCAATSLVAVGIWLIFIAQTGRFLQVFVAFLAMLAGELLLLPAWQRRRMRTVVRRRVERDIAETRALLGVRGLSSPALIQGVRRASARRHTGDLAVTVPVAVAFLVLALTHYASWFWSWGLSHLLILAGTSSNPLQHHVLIGMSVAYLLQLALLLAPFILWLCLQSDSLRSLAGPEFGKSIRITLALLLAVQLLPNSALSEPPWLDYGVGWRYWSGTAEAHGFPTISSQATIWALFDGQISIAWFYSTIWIQRRWRALATPYDNLLLGTVGIAALVNSATGPLRARDIRRASHRLSHLAEMAEISLSLSDRVPRAHRESLESEARRVAAVYRAHVPALATAHSQASIVALVDSLLCAAESLARGDREALLANAPIAVPPSRRLRRIAAWAWPPLALIASGLLLPLIPQLAHRAVADSLRWTLIVAGVLTLAAGRNIAGQVGSSLEKSLPWR